MVKLKYFGTTITNTNLIHEEIMSRVTWVMLAAIQFRAFCSSGALLDTIQSRTLCVVLYGRETWSLILREGRD
jgi:hypothetical protein